MVVLVLCAALSCDQPYLHNDNLELALRKPGHHCFCPRLSPDGSRVYYLDDTTLLDRMGWDEVSGQLRVFDLVDSTDRLLLDCRTSFISMSLDGSLIVTAQDTILLVYDVDREQVETLPRQHLGYPHMAPSGAWVIGRRHNSPSIDDYSYYRFAPESGSQPESLTSLTYSVHFDVYADDSVFVDTAVRGEQPAVCPADTRWVVFSRLLPISSSWMVLDRKNGRVGSLGKYAQPYLAGFLSYPSWSADGRDLVFSAAMAKTPDDWMEIWVLRDAGRLLR